MDTIQNKSQRLINTTVVSLKFVWWYCPFLVIICDLFYYSQMFRNWGSHFVLRPKFIRSYSIILSLYYCANASEFTKKYGYKRLIAINIKRQMCEKCVKGVNDTADTEIMGMASQMMLLYGQLNIDPSNAPNIEFWSSLYIHCCEVDASSAVFYVCLATNYFPLIRFSIGIPIELLQVFIYAKHS